MAAATEEVSDKRSFAQVLYHDLVNYIYFFTPLVIVHNVAWYVTCIIHTQCLKIPSEKGQFLRVNSSTHGRCFPSILWNSFF